MSEYKFVNPYNFIPLEKERARTKQEKNVYSGVICYSVLTKTPLFIPNTSNDHALYPNEDEHKSYEFFSYTDLSGMEDAGKKPSFPVIPGSEMRGMLRSNYEILTNSCMSAIDDEAVLSKRTGEVFKAGLLKKKENGYDLYEAEDCLLRTAGENNLDCTKWKSDNRHYKLKCYRQKDLQEGEKVFLDVKKRRGKPLVKNVKRCIPNANAAAPIKTGYVIKGEDGPEGSKQQKHCCHIFCLKNKLVKGNISISCLDSVLKEYQKQDACKYQEYVQNLTKFKKEGKAGEFFPVYYSRADEKSDYFFLSPASITREVYQNKLKKIIRGHRTCTDKNNLCPACALFGIINENLKISSRIRVSDLTCDAENEGIEAEKCYDECITLMPLAQPKLNNMEFYLKRPNDAWFWTYDYYIDKNGKVTIALPEINGRKFYWHQMEVKLKNQEETNLNKSIRPVKKGIKFSGKIFFNRISKTELDQLIYLLNAGDTKTLEEKEHGYKLGAAKPFGLGSIAVSVNEVTLRNYCKDSQTKTVLRKEEPYEDYKEPAFEKTTRDYFSRMTDFDAVKGQNVSYPRLNENDINIFEWFTNNHTAYKNGKKIGMANTRKQMAFEKYMKAMEPELIVTKESNQ